MNTAKSNSSLAEPKRLPGEVGVWIFVFGDMLFFAVLFGVFLHYRGLEPDVFMESQARLNKVYGVMNMLLLLTSSWFVASAVDQLKKGAAARTRQLLIGAFICGASFALIKSLEYAEKTGAGFTVFTNNFYLYYYILTGIHFFHLTIGMAVLGYLIVKAKTADSSPRTVQHFESGGVYWHMVDLLWIVLFPLLYLMP